MPTRRKGSTVPSDAEQQFQVECAAVGETERVATEFASRLSPGSWVGLIGPLGAGKSVFARAIGRAWGVTEVMPSPSYTLMASHEGRCPIYHIDLYRTSSSVEIEFADLLPYFDGSGICLVEWADRAPAIWPSSGWTVTIEIIAEGSRHITIASFPAVSHADRGGA
jgi:tRNA threonylcarbamoyladenosine biosynthesis protein TsaE